MTPSPHQASASSVPAPAVPGDLRHVCQGLEHSRAQRSAGQLSCGQVSCQETGLFPESCRDFPLLEPSRAGGVGGGGSESLQSGWQRPDPQQGPWVEGRCQGGCMGAGWPHPVWGRPRVPSPHPILSYPPSGVDWAGREGKPATLTASSPAACPQGRFGPNCTRVCGCGHGAACDPVTGTCLCPPGRAGVRCERGGCSVWRVCSRAPQRCH